MDKVIDSEIETIDTPEDCIRALEVIRDRIGVTGDDSHYYADQAILKLLESMGHIDVVDAYWDSSDHFWYA